MNGELMVHDANQIALFFAAYPRDEAIAGIAGHLRLFWPPGLRRQLADYVATGGAGLHELALAAAASLAG